MKIKIITDTSSGLSKSECDKLGYALIALPFYLDGVEYNDFIMDKNEYYDKLEKSKTVSTSQASIETVTSLFDMYLKEYDEILYIPIASGLSSSYNTGCMLADDEKYKGKVFCVKHRTLSVPQSVMLSDAKKMIDAGMDAKDIKDVIENNITENIWLTTDTLDYFSKGGRLSKVTAIIGKLLGIVPILFSDGEKFGLIRKERGVSRALNIMKELLENKIIETISNTKNKVTLCIAHTRLNDRLKEYINLIKEIAKKYKLDICINELSSVLVCHTGPRAIGIAVYCNDYSLNESL